MYREGQGVPQDYAEAVCWYRKAAEHWHCGALFELGKMFYEGKGVPQDYAEAARWYSKSADQGLTSAQYRLGLMYHEGRGVPQDYAEAARLYREAAEWWDTDAQFGLGVLYYEGQGVARDFTKAHMWLNLAASQVSGEQQKVYASWRDRVARKMTAQQIAEAQRLAAAFCAEWDDNFAQAGRKQR
jgi:TPR repeat protein